MLQLSLSFAIQLLANVSLVFFQNCVSFSRAKCLASETKSIPIEGVCGTTGVCRAQFNSVDYVYPHHPHCQVHHPFTSINRSTPPISNVTVTSLVTEWFLFLTQLGTILTK